MEGTPSLVGRDAELAQLTEALHATRAGEGRLVLVSGEPGIGKTVLLEALAGSAAETGVRTVWGRCWEGGGAAAFWPWTQVLRALLDEGRDLGGTDGDLGQLLPEQGAAVPASGAGAAEGPDARIRLFDAVRLALRAAARDGGLVVALDDVHAADQGSLELLRFVAGDLATAPVLVAASYREADLGVSPGHQRLLTAAARHAHTIRLRGLGEAHVVELLDRTAVGADRGLAHRIHQATDGNPFLVGEAARVVAEGRERGDTAVHLPAEARHLVGRRLDALDDATRRLVAVAAVLGREFDVAILGVVAETRPEAVLDGLSDAERRAVVEEVGLGRWAFRHALLRESLVATLDPAVACDLNRRAADALLDAHPTEASAHHAQVAHHLVAAGDPRALSACARAGEAAMAVMAYEEAAQWYQRALDGLFRSATPDLRLAYDLLMTLAAARTNSGDIDDALDVYDRVFATARSLGSVELLAEAAVRTARTTPSARTPAIISALDDALCDLPEEDSSLRAQVMVSFARALSNSTVGMDVLLQVNNQGLAMARRLGPHDRLWDTLWTWHQTSGLIWDVPAERLEVGRQLIALAEEAGDLARLTLAREAFLADRVQTGDLHTARVEIAEAARDAERLRQPYLLWRLGIRRVQLALLQGELAQAEQLAKEALKAGQRSGLDDAELTYVSHLVSVRRFEGKWDELEALTEEALERWRLASGADCAQMYPMVYATAEFRGVDDARRAIARYVPKGFLDRHLKTTLVPGEVGRLCCVTSVAEMLWLTGDATWAPALYPLLLPHAARHVFVPDSESRGGVSRYLGQLAALSGRHDVADSHFRQAHEQHARFGARIWQALGWWDHARMLVTRGDPGDVDRARQLLMSARDAFRSMNMGAYAQEAERRLGALPRPAERATIGRDADHWTLEYAGQVVRLQDSKGIRYLVELLRQPGRGFAAAELAEDAADAERARQSVSRAVKTTIDRVSETHPVLAEHLRATVRTGVESVYVRDPRAPIVWDCPSVH